MKFIHRLAYYLGGFSLGIVMLVFFLSGKKTSCDYFPSARVLKSIRSKNIVFSAQAQEHLKTLELDSVQIYSILKSGDVKFSRSNTSGDSCHRYLVTGKTENNSLEMNIQNCDSIATIQNIIIPE